MADNAKLFVVTPAGTAQYPRINKPDAKYGNYEVNLVLPIEQAKPLVAQLNGLLHDSYVPGKLKDKSKVKLPYKIDREEGTVTFLFKSKKQPAVYDLKGHKVDSEVSLGGGSIIKVSALVRPYAQDYKDVGLKAYLNGVQVLKLVEYKKSDFGDASGELGDEPGFVAGEVFGVVPEDDASLALAKRKEAAIDFAAIADEIDSDASDPLDF
jgi:hypothetical protein